MGSWRIGHDWATNTTTTIKIHMCRYTCMYIWPCEVNKWTHSSSAFKRSFSSVQLICSVMSDSFRPHGLQHARPPCPSSTPGVHPNTCPLGLSQWGHPTISSSVIPFSSYPQSFPASGPFQMSQLFALGGQSIGVSASTSVLPMNTQDCSPLGWMVRSPWSPRDSQESSPTVQKHQYFSTQLSL